MRCDVARAGPIPASPAANTTVALSRLDPAGAVLAMIGAFGRRSESDYVSWMAENFVFESDDSEFRAAFPAGMSRADEHRFATKLFHGGARGPDGPLPIATRIDTSAGTLVATPFDATHVRIVLDHLHARIGLSDGSAIEVMEGHNVMDLVYTRTGWRIQRWQERHGAAVTDEPLAQTTTSHQDSSQTAP